MSEDATGAPPRHPLYLDVPMMTSFLAYLEGGVADTLERVSTSKADVSKQKEGGAGVKVPSVFSILGFDASGRMASTTASGTVDEFKIARQHTSASLFNLLYDELQAQSMIKTFGGSADDLSELRIGDLVELDGRYTGNPLEDLLAVVNQFLRYFASDGTDDTSSADIGPREAAKRSGNPAKKSQAGRLTAEAVAAQEAARLQAEERAAQQAEQAFGLVVAQQMLVEVQGSPVADVVLKTESDLRIVATVAREFLTDQVSALLRSSNATILGKVTALAGEGEAINLTRRTVMGALGGEQVREILNSATGSEGFAWNTEDPIVSGPTAQVMPLAIYI